MTYDAGKPRCRILLVIAGLTAGGAERQMVSLARGLDRSRYEVGFLIFNSADRIHYREVFEQPLWFRALELSRERSGVFGLIVGMVNGIRKAVSDFKPDVVHTTLNVANVAVRAAKMLFFPRIPVISSIRCNYQLLYTRRDQILEKLLCRYSNIILTNSEPTRQQLLNALSLPSERVVTVENGLDSCYVPGSSPVPLAWPACAKRVGLIVGRLTEEKNHLALIRALKVLDEHKQLGDWCFVLIGEGRLRDQIELEISDFPRFILLPPAFDLVPYYHNAEILILPSLHEGISNVALEAQACGLPVAIRHSANTSGIVTNDWGWILEGDLVLSLSKVLKLTSYEINSRGVLASQNIRARFGDTKMVNSIQDIYDTFRIK